MTSIWSREGLLEIKHTDGCVHGRRYNNALLQLTVSCLYLAAVVGALGSELARPYGRKVRAYPILYHPMDRPTARTQAA